MFKPLQFLTRTFCVFGKNSKSPFKNYYKILELQYIFTKSELKSSFIKNVQKYHPDINHDPDAAEKFISVSEGYRILKNDAKRKKYDSVIICVLILNFIKA